jgi:hypothetical protein
MQAREKPVTRENDDLIVCARLLEQVPGSRHNHDVFLAGELCERVLVQFDHLSVVSPDDQKGRRPDPRKCSTRQVRAAAAGHDSRDPVPGQGSATRAAAAPVLAPK